METPVYFIWLIFDFYFAIVDRIIQMNNYNPPPPHQELELQSNMIMNWHKVVVFTVNIVILVEIIKILGTLYLQCYHYTANHFKFPLDQLKNVQTSTYYAQQVCKIIHLCTKLEVCLCTFAFFQDQLPNVKFNLRHFESSTAIATKVTKNTSIHTFHIIDICP